MCRALFSSDVSATAAALPKKVRAMPDEGFEGVKDVYAFVREEYKGVKPPKRHLLDQMITL